MTALDIALAMVKRFEGCRLNAYRDIVGVLTIGYGETLNVHAGMAWTQEQADSTLKRRLAYFLAGIIKRCPQLQYETDNRIAACLSLAYNIGLGAFGASSVCRHTKRKEYTAAANSFLLWDKAGGKKVRGLTIRRTLERKHYLGEK